MNEMFVFKRDTILTFQDFPSREEAVLLLERDVPWLSKLYFKFEKEYDGISLLLWSRSHYWLAPFFCILYLAFIWKVPKMMQSRKPWNLDAPLRYWNLGLALYSCWGAIRVVPHILVFLYKFGWLPSLCSPPVFTYGRGAVGLWTGLFIYSKYFELIDTVFIVLRKRRLNFLHWYHHVTVLMYTWDAFVTEQPPGVFYCGMNYAVHSIMYFYYFLAAVQTKPPKWGMFVTVLQIAQMVGGMIITGMSLKNSFTMGFMYRSTRAIAEDPSVDNTCYISRTNMLSAAAMYSTYLYLFASFFYQRYYARKKTPYFVPTLKSQKID